MYRSYYIFSNYDTFSHNILIQATFHSFTLMLCLIAVYIIELIVYRSYIHHLICFSLISSKESAIIHQKLLNFILF